MDMLNIIDSRRHALEFKTDDIPSEELIRSIIWKAWKVTPSKQNFMPYTITILGPDRMREKYALWELAVKNKIRVNEENSKIPWKESGYNVNYEYLKHAPYSYIFSQRVCKANPFIQRTIDDLNDFYEQMHESHLDAIYRSTCTEVGMFAAHMAAFAIEEGVTVNYNGCFPSNVKDWSNILPIIDYNPILIGGMGYCKTPRRKKFEDLPGDYKPEVDELLEWI